MKKKQRNGFEINYAALRRATEYFGLELPVVVRLHGRQGPLLGSYRLNRARDGNYHDIMVKRYLAPAQASKTLWHELTHAMQAERAANEANVALHSFSACAVWGKASQSGSTYRNCPLELEARDFEKDQPMLTRSSRGRH